MVKDFKPQVSPREINLFYLFNDKRLRITKDVNRFGTTENPTKWTLQSLSKEIEKHPERFSPNALMRPLYQECVLPNIAYIGGGGELAYWLQLKTTFEIFALFKQVVDGYGSITFENKIRGGVAGHIE